MSQNRCNLHRGKAFFFFSFWEQFPSSSIGSVLASRGVWKGRGADRSAFSSWFPFCECLLGVTRRAAKQRPPGWINRCDTDTRKISRHLFVLEWRPAQDDTDRWPSPLHLMWIKSVPPSAAPPLACTPPPTPFNSNLARVTFHRLGSSLSRCGSDVTRPPDRSKKKGHIVSGGHVLLWSLWDEGKLCLETNPVVSRF